jgi:hypothetical protein
VSPALPLAQSVPVPPPLDELLLEDPLDDPPFDPDDDPLLLDVEPLDDPVAPLDDPAAPLDEPVPVLLSSPLPLLLPA